MTKLPRIAWFGLLLSWLATSSDAHAQCPEWKQGFHINGIYGEVFALASFDDGSGPALYAGGRFTSASGVSAVNVARWNGSAWSPLGAGVGVSSSSAVVTMTVFDDGSGPALYVAGTFNQAGGVAANGIAKWNGSTWSALGTGASSIFDLAVFDDGSGPALYGGGIIGLAGGVSVNNIAKWDGATWSALGSGVDSDEYPSVSDIAVFDDGSGPGLYAGGNFTTAGGLPASNIAKWDGSSWSALGTGTDSEVRALAAFDDGSGARLYVSGFFNNAGGIPVDQFATWDGGNWAPFGNGMSGFVRDLVVFDDGSGPALHAGGSFSAGNLGARGIAKWNGTDWKPLRGGVALGQVHALVVFDDGSGPALCAGGEFTTAGGAPANNIASWNGSAWSKLGDGAGLDNTVFAMAVFDDGTGPALHVGGGFTSAGDKRPGCIAKWDGTSWSLLGSGVAREGAAPALVNALAVFDDGSGPALYAGGAFTMAGGMPALHIAKWDGTFWSPLGSGIGNPTGTKVNTLAVFDDGSGPALYAGGVFATAGGAPANFIARWDGSVWTPLGTGFSGLASHIWIEALAVFDDGTGPALYAGGSFSSAGGTPARGIAKWNGSAWSSPGSPNHDVTCLASFEDETGPGLYVGGYFSAIDGTPAQQIAKWNGTSWSPLGSGVAAQWCEISAMTGFDDGSGPALYAGGVLSTAGGVPVNGIAKWDGSQWSSPGSGVDYEPALPSHVFALASFDDGSSRSLYAGGILTHAGDEYSNFIAAWSACPGIGTGLPFCFGDGSGSACPCSNTGAAGHGCNNSAQTGGSRLSATGMASLAADTLRLTASGEMPSALSTFWQGRTNVGPLIYGDGLRCMGGALKRLRHESAVAGVVVYPDGAETPVATRSAALGDPLFIGSRRIYQVTYRDPSPSFCPPGTVNISSALEIVWAP